MMPAFARAAADAPTASSSETLLGQAVAALERVPTQIASAIHDLIVWIAGHSLAALTAVALGLAIYALLAGLRRWVRRRLLRHEGTSGWRWVVLKVLARTRGFFLIMFSAEVVSTLLFDLPSSIQQLEAVLFAVAAAIQGAYWVREFLLALVQRKAVDADQDTGLSSALGVVTVLINLLVWTIAGIILLDNLGISVTGLVAGLGIGGIAIGLAAQGIFSDLFAALSILFDQPFRQGDVIQVGGPQGITGTVEHIGMKTTRLRAISGEMVVLSNANLLSQQISNLSTFEARRVVMALPLIRQTPERLLDRLQGELRAIVEAVPDCRFERAHFVQFGPSSIDFELVYRVETPDFLAMLDARHRIGLAIVKRFDALDIDLAYPAQTSFLAGPDGRILMPSEVRRGGRAGMVRDA